MPVSSDHDDTPKPPERGNGEDKVVGRPYSRVEAEVLEILQRTDRPVSLSDHVRRKAARARRARLERATGRLRDAQEAIGPGTMLIACVGLAFGSFLVRDASALLANVLAIASVVCLIWPIVERFRRPAGPSNRRWRGRDMDFVPPADPPRWVRDLRERFRRPPRL
jgi:hypothetical protein